MLSRAVVCEVDVSAEHREANTLQSNRRFIVKCECMHSFAAFLHIFTRGLNDSLDRNRVYLFQRTPAMPRAAM